MIKNRHLAKDARVRLAGPARIVLATDGAQTQTILVDSLRAVRPLRLHFVYTIASDTGSVAPINVGKPGTATLLADWTPLVSKAAGTVATVEPTSTAFIAAGTPIIVASEAGTLTNTGQVDVFLEYEIIDRSMIG